MTYGLYKKQLTQTLQQLYDAGEAATIADWVLEDITGFTRIQFRPMQNEIIPSAIYHKLKAAQEQLLKHKPIQYVLGHTYFCGLKFLVNEAVLIPRPETEELVEWIVNSYEDNKRPLQILDIGTGSGCIPVALKKRLPPATVSSLDISNEALLLAKKNAQINEVQIQFQLLDFLDETKWPQLAEFDIIISNPPYIPLQEKATLDKNVTAWEPDIALFVPNADPLLFYRKIAAFGKTHLLNGGALFMETHQAYANAVEELFTATGYEAVVKKDMHGNDRMVMATNN